MYKDFNQIWFSCIVLYCTNSSYYN